MVAATGGAAGALRTAGAAVQSPRNKVIRTLTETYLDFVSRSFAPKREVVTCEEESTEIQCANSILSHIADLLPGIFHEHHDKGAINSGNALARTVELLLQYICATPEQDLTLGSSGNLVSSEGNEVGSASVSDALVQLKASNILLSAAALKRLIIHSPTLALPPESPSFRYLDRLRRVLVSELAFFANTSFPLPREHSSLLEVLEVSFGRSTAALAANFSGKMVGSVERSEEEGSRENDEGKWTTGNDLFNAFSTRNALLHILTTNDVLPFPESYISLIHQSRMTFGLAGISSEAACNLARPGEFLESLVGVLRGSTLEVDLLEIFDEGVCEALWRQHYQTHAESNIKINNPATPAALLFESLPKDSAFSGLFDVEGVLKCPPLLQRIALLSSVVHFSALASPFLKAAALENTGFSIFHSPTHALITPISHLSALLQPWTQEELEKSLADSASDSKAFAGVLKIRSDTANALAAPNSWAKVSHHPISSGSFFSQLYRAMAATPLAAYAVKGDDQNPNAPPRLFNVHLTLEDKGVRPVGYGHAINCLNDAVAEVFKPGFLYPLANGATQGVAAAKEVSAALLQAASLTSHTSAEGLMGTPGDSFVGVSHSSYTHGVPTSPPSSTPVISLPSNDAPLACCEFLGLLMGWSLRFSASLPFDWSPHVWRYCVGACRPGDSVVVSHLGPQLMAIKRGLGATLPLSALTGMPWRVLRDRTAGSPEVTLEGIKSHCAFIEPLSPEHPTVLKLWEVIGTWKNEDLARLLKCITGSLRLPLADTQWSWSVKVDKGMGSLVRTSSCTSTLFLPENASNLEWSLFEALASGINET